MADGGAVAQGVQNRVVVCTPRSLVSKRGFKAFERGLVDRPGESDNTLDLDQRLSAGRETACFMRSRKPVFGSAGLPG